MLWYFEVFDLIKWRVSCDPATSSWNSINLHHSIFAWLLYLLELLVLIEMVADVLDFAEVFYLDRDCKVLTFLVGHFVELFLRQTELEHALLKFLAFDEALCVDELALLGGEHGEIIEFDIDRIH